MDENLFLKAKMGQLRTIFSLQRPGSPDCDEQNKKVYKMIMVDNIQVSVTELSSCCIRCGARAHNVVIIGHFTRFIHWKGTVEGTFINTWASRSSKKKPND